MLAYSSGIRIFIIVLSLLVLNGCHSSAVSPLSQESKVELLAKSKNYSALIDLYRERLNKNDNNEDRYNLSYQYYLSEDCTSALHYLKPLTTGNIRSRILEVKSYISCEKYNEAISSASQGLKSSPGNYELLNLKGIAEALSGKLEMGRRSIQQARDLFIDDRIAVNNLAMIEIINKNYNGAVRMLLPVYKNGHKDPIMLHNLILALIKDGDIVYAKKIIESENLSDNANRLIESLKQTNGV